MFSNLGVFFSAGVLASTDITSRLRVLLLFGLEINKKYIKIKPLFKYFMNTCRPVHWLRTASSVVMRLTPRNMNHHILFKTKFASLMRYFRDKILIPLSKENTGSPFNSGLIAYPYIAHNEAIYVARCSHETKIGSHPYPISHCKFRDLTENSISQEKKTLKHTHSTKLSTS